MSDLTDSIGLTDDGPFVRELAQYYEDEGVTKAHVSWASMHSHEYLARVMLDQNWQISRGHSYCIKNIDEGDPWYHLPKLLSNFRRWRDIKLLRMDPYGMRCTTEQWNQRQFKKWEASTDG